MSTTNLPLRLHHLSIPHRIPYTASLALQSHILNQHFAYRTHLRTPSTPTPPPPSIPLPALLTFSTHPAYTVGRRHLETNPLSQSQIDFLTAADITNSRPPNRTAASFHATSRGGLLTYHGPGQLTAYPLLDLRAHSLGPKQYVRLLESIVIATCTSLGVPNVGVSCTDPGVWMLDPHNNNIVTDRKICALGVQITRGVTSHGIGLNVYDQIIPPRHRRKSVDVYGIHPLSSVRTVDHRTEGFLSWGFGRIVACGLEGKSTTWLAREFVDARERKDGRGEGQGEEKLDKDEEGMLKGVGWGRERTAGVLAEELMRGLRGLKEGDGKGKGQIVEEGVERVLDETIEADKELKKILDGGVQRDTDARSGARHKRLDLNQE